MATLSSLIPLQDSGVPPNPEVSYCIAGSSWKASSALNVPQDYEIVNVKGQYTGTRQKRAPVSHMVCDLSTVAKTIVCASGEAADGSSQMTRTDTGKIDTESPNFFCVSGSSEQQVESGPWSATHCAKSIIQAYQEGAENRPKSTVVRCRHVDTETPISFSLSGWPMTPRAAVRFDFKPFSRDTRITDASHVSNVSPVSFWYVPTPEEDLDPVTTKLKALANGKDIRTTSTYWPSPDRLISEAQKAVPGCNVQSEASLARAQNVLQGWRRNNWRFASNSREPIDQTRGSWFDVVPKDASSDPSSRVKVECTVQSLLVPRHVVHKTGDPSPVSSAYR